VYAIQADGSEIRRHRNILLGLKAEMDKSQAKEKLRSIIAKETSNVSPAPLSVTLRWLTTVKDVQAHLRHANAATTLEHYIKSVPASVRVAVESLGSMLKSKAEETSGRSN
jgi:hypothetical protein